MNNNKKVRIIITVSAIVMLLAGVILKLAEPSSAITTYGTSTAGNRLKLIYTITTENDVSTIDWTLYSARTSTSYTTFKRLTPLIVKIGNDEVKNTTVTYDVRNGGSSLAYGSFDVKRINGGATTVPFYASVDLEGTSVGGLLTMEVNFRLSAYESGSRNITVNVDWIDNNNEPGQRPEAITVTVYRNGTAYKEAEVLTTEDKVTFEGLPAAYGGSMYRYTFGGEEVEEYIVGEPSAGDIVYKYAKVPEMGIRLGFSI